MAQDCLILRDATTGAELLGRASLVKFELDTGSEVKIPDNWVMGHDVVGTIMKPCDLRIMPCSGRKYISACDNDLVCRIAYAYFGHGRQLVETTVEIPTGPWHGLGRVARVYYARSGKFSGLYHHPFKMDAPPVLLFKQDSGEGFRLTLPPGCIVDSHGFVWP